MGKEKYTRTISTNGRLCNQIIRNLCVSFIAEKHDLFVEYSNYNIINNKLGIPLHIGSKKHEAFIDMKNENFFKILEMSDLNSNINANHHFFQTKEIGKYIYKHLYNIQETIIAKNRWKDRYKNNDDIFVHMRLGDISKKGFELHIDYYQEALSKLCITNKIYIGTDSPKHEMINIIKETYPNVEILTLSAEDTIQFGSTCKNIILSCGTYSTIIGYLGFFSTVYYPNLNRSKKKWFRDMYIDSWICV